MLPTDLIEYVRKQKHSGISDSEIKKRLLNVGWTESAVSDALKSYDAPLPNSDEQVQTLTDISNNNRLPVENDQRNMLYTFQHVLMFLTMAVYTFSTNSMFHLFIDKWVPSPKDTASFWTRASNTTYVYTLIAAIFVSFPIFITLFLINNKQKIKNPDFRCHHYKTVLTYATLVVTFIVMLSNVGTVIFRILNGEFSLNIFLHFLSPVVICSLIFWYFINDILHSKSKK